MGLEEAHRRAAAIIGPGAEDFAVAAEVERLRQRWRPDRVRVILLAESHVWTSVEELRSRVTQPDGVTTGFARFVYCLGYGEPALVQPGVSRNRGTPQYWALFHTALSGPAGESRPSGKPDATCAIRTLRKLLLLHELQAAGIWLVDASVTALVMGSSRLASGRAYRGVLQACWHEYVREAIARCRPSGVLVVGKMVHDAIGQDVRKLVGEYDFIHQPNDRNLGGDRMREQQERLYRFCSRTRAAGRPQVRRVAGRLSQAATQALERTVKPGARYRATRLTFKRKVIEPLAPHDAFEVDTPDGLFRMTKRDFYAAFPNVVASRSYREIGFYNYQKAPRQAAKFLVKAVAGAGAGLQ